MSAVATSSAGTSVAGPSAAGTSNGAESDWPRSARWPRSASNVLARLLTCHQQADERAWHESLHECSICLEQAASVDCVRLLRCHHTFCKGCLGGYFSSLIVEGKAAALHCPEIGCKTTVTPAEVKLLVGANEFEMYERLLLQLSLAEMEDVVWCPRQGCEYPALLHEANGTLATCGKCGFAFCTECRQAWHGLAPCANLAERWRNGDEAAREALREKYGTKFIEELQTSEWVKSNTKPCIRCTARIEKNGGCNHITCHKCGMEWCWLCEKKYTPGHYQNGTCVQFSQDFFDEIGMSPDDFHRHFRVLNHF